MVKIPESGLSMQKAHRFISPFLDTVRLARRLKCRGAEVEIILVRYIPSNILQKSKDSYKLRSALVQRVNQKSLNGLEE